jgi:hypothetical protein
VVGVPISLPTWTNLFVNIEATSRSLEGKGGLSGQPGQPACFICGIKTLFQMTMGIELILKMILRPDECMKR